MLLDIHDESCPGLALVAAAPPLTATYILGGRVIISREWKIS